VCLEALGHMIQKFLFYRHGKCTLTQCFVGLSQTEKRNVRTACGKQFDEHGLRLTQATVLMKFKDSFSWTQQKNAKSPMGESRVTDSQNR